MRAARSGSESIRMCSSSAWAPAPRGPRPSRVGIPRADVKLPSLPPPVDPSVSSRPRRSASGELPGFLEEGRVGAGSLHRRPVE